MFNHCLLIHLHCIRYCKSSKEDLKYTGGCVYTATFYIRDLSIKSFGMGGSSGTNHLWTPRDDYTFIQGRKGPGRGLLHMTCRLPRVPLPGHEGDASLVSLGSFPSWDHRWEIASGPVQGILLVVFLWFLMLMHNCGPENIEWMINI